MFQSGISNSLDIRSRHSLVRFINARRDARDGAARRSEPQTKLAVPNECACGREGGSPLAVALRSGAIFGAGSGRSGRLISALALSPPQSRRRTTVSFMPLGA